MSLDSARRLIVHDTSAAGPSFFIGSLNSRQIKYERAKSIQPHAAAV